MRDKTENGNHYKGIYAVTLRILPALLKSSKEKEGQANHFSASE